MFSIKDAAQAVGIHPKTIRRWENQGKFIPQRTLGNQRRFSSKDVVHLKNLKSGQAPFPATPLDLILTPTQAAAKLDVSLATLNRWNKEGKISYKLDSKLQPGYPTSQINSLFKKEVSPLPKPLTTAAAISSST